MSFTPNAAAHVARFLANQAGPADVVVRGSYSLGTPAVAAPTARLFVVAEQGEALPVLMRQLGARGQMPRVAAVVWPLEQTGTRTAMRDDARRILDAHGFAHFQAVGEGDEAELFPLDDAARGAAFSLAGWYLAAMQEEQAPSAPAGAPLIAPVPAGVARPRWSVMIPTFNCARYLRETLESVLAQDPGADAMQIEVVDDVSTRDDPERVVREVGRGRVSFYRHAANVGISRNFNACVRRARGELVHILHGDDAVRPGFYAAVDAAAHDAAHVALVATRAVVIDERGFGNEVSPMVQALALGSRDARAFFRENPLRTPGVVVRRAFYEQCGGFMESLRHTADWEMWARAVALGGGLMVDAPLVSYRWFPANDTSQLMRSGDNLRDHLRIAEHMGDYAGFDAKALTAAVAVHARSQATHFANLGDAVAERANAELAAELAAALAGRAA